MDLEAYADVLPWVMFVIVDRSAGLGIGWAGACAVACAAGLLLRACATGRRASIARIAVVLFGALCAVGFLIGGPSRLVDEICRAAAVGVLGLIALASLVWRPLSEEYTETRVVPTAWAGSRFARLNHGVTAAWGLGAIAIAVSYALGILDRSHVALTVFEWVLPLAITAVTAGWVHWRWEQFRVGAERALAELEGLGPAPTTLEWPVAASRDAVVHGLRAPQIDHPRAR